MLKRVIIALTLVAVGAGTAAIVFAAFIVPHQATGTVNTAVSGVEELYICQPSGTTTDPQCPIDTGGADETIFAANEDLLAGSTEWQKIRLTNIGSDAWDLLDMTPTWTEISDPSGLCETIPEGVRWQQSRSTLDSPTGPGITVLGNEPGFDASNQREQEPVEDVWYPSVDLVNDNHGPVNGTPTYHNMDLSSNYKRTVHVEPGGFEDILLGIRLPTGTPSDCVNVVWTLTTTWTVQVHSP